MANTTNYNWETPDDTDLVKDGAAAIRTLGSSIDTTTKNLNPETTTGDISYRSATANTNTRLAIGSTGQVLTVAAGVPSWETPTAGDIEGVTAGTGISGGGTSGTVTITNSMATAIDAKGDLIGGTGADTFARLAVGANNTVLTADSSTSTGLKWAAPSAGALTYVGGSTFSAVTSVSVNDVFSATYENYVIYLNATKDSGGPEAGFLRLRVSGSDDTNSVYNVQDLYGQGASAIAERLTTQDKGAWSDINTAETVTVIQMFRPFATAKTNWQSNTLNYGGTGIEAHLKYCTFTNTTSFTGFSLIKSGTGNMSGTIRVYGLANS
jgi:hypothetical protein